MAARLRHGRGRPAAVAPGELAWTAVLETLHAEEGEELGDPLATHATRRAAQAKGDVLGHSAMREEGLVLGYVAHTPLMRWQIATLGAVVERLAVEEHTAGVWLHNASNSL